MNYHNDEWQKFLQGYCEICFMKFKRRVLIITVGTRWKAGRETLITNRFQTITTWPAVTLTVIYLRTGIKDPRQHLFVSLGMVS